MEQITIPRGTQVTIRQTKDGKPITMFVCQKVGTDVLLAPCEAWGDRKAQIEESLASGKPIDVESVAWDSKYNVNKVQFPKGSGGEANYRNKFGSNRQWVPNGYKGKPLPFEAWVRVSTEIMVQAAAMMATACPDADANVRASEARSILAQYWMAVKDNVTFPDKYEPAPAAAESAPAGASAAAQPVAETPTVKAYRSMITSAANDAMVNMVEGQVRGDTSLGAAQAVLLGECMERKRAIAMAGGAA